MAERLRYRADLFKGTAEHYDRYRPPYPDRLLDELRARAGVGGASRVLDLACGTGQIAFGLAAHVAEVVAVDQEEEAVAFGARKAAGLGVTNIRWVAAAAEDVDLGDDRPLDLVAIGNAFHRLDREAVAGRLATWLRPGGCVALLWSESPWAGETPWQRAFDEVLQRWRDRRGARDRVPEGWKEGMARDPHATVLGRAGLTSEGLLETTTTHRWSVESLIGLVYSTSFLNRTVLGEDAPAFEADLRRRLLACCPDGVFEQELWFGCELARSVEAPDARRR